MSDPNGLSIPNVDDGTGLPLEGENIAQLREAAKHGRRLEKENLFLRAGVDLTSPVAAGLFKSYDGEMTVAALTTTAKEWGLIQEPEQTEPPPSADELEQQRFREGGQGGEPLGTAPPPNPNSKDNAHRAYLADLAAGVPRENAQLGLIDRYISGAAEGNKEFLQDDETWLRQRAEVGYDFTRKRT